MNENESVDPREDAMLVEDPEDDMDNGHMENEEVSSINEHPMSSTDGQSETMEGRSLKRKTPESDHQDDVDSIPSEITRRAEELIEEVEANALEKEENSMPSHTEVEPKQKGVYVEKMEELKAEIDSIRAENHEELQEELQRLAKLRDRKLQDADMVRELRTREIQALYDFEVKAANDFYQAEKALIIQRMQSQVEDMMKKLEDLKNGVAVEDVRSHARSLRSKSKGDTLSNGFEVLEYDKTSKVKRIEGIGINFFMTESDIISDIQAIQSNWQSSAEKFALLDESKENSAKIKNGTLIYNDEEFSKDDQVIIQTELTKEEMLGQISNIQANEINIRLADDSKARLLLSHLESGRCKITKASEPLENI